MTCDNAYVSAYIHGTREDSEAPLVGKTSLLWLYIEQKLPVRKSARKVRNFTHTLGLKSRQAAVTLAFLIIKMIKEYTSVINRFMKSSTVD